MPRLRMVPRSEVDDPFTLSMYDFIFGDRDPVAEPGTPTGSSGDWWPVFANVPAVLRHSVQGFRLYQSSSIDPVLRELGQARVGWAVGSQFVFSQHCKSLRGLGVDEERIGAIPGWQAANCYSEIERHVLAYADCLALDRGRVPDALFDALLAHFGDAGMLELTYITALYLQHAVMSRALRTEFDDVPERVVEIGRSAGLGIAGPDQ